MADTEMKYACCLCGKEFTGWGNNPWPLCDESEYESRCCDNCNTYKVIPARMSNMYGRKQG